MEEVKQDIHYTLGRIEGKIDGISNLQAIANGRTEKLENNYKALELLFNQRLEGQNNRIDRLETEKDLMVGRLQSAKWIWGIIIVIIGMGQFVIGKFW